MKIFNFLIIFCCLSSCLPTSITTKSNDPLTNSEEVLMSCEWSMYGDNYDSFVFNLSKKTVYWIEENKRFPIMEINEGRIVFEGVKGKLSVDAKSNNFENPDIKSEEIYKYNVPIRFIINRVTGHLSAEKIKSIGGLCKTTKEKVI